MASLGARLRAAGRRAKLKGSKCRDRCVKCPPPPVGLSLSIRSDLLRALNDLFAPRELGHARLPSDVSRGNMVRLPGVHVGTFSRAFYKCKKMRPIRR